MKNEIPIILLIIFILFVMFIINPVDFPPKGIKKSIAFLKDNFSTILLIILVMFVVLIVMTLTGVNKPGQLEEKLDSRKALISFVTPKHEEQKKKEFKIPKKLPSDKEIRQNTGTGQGIATTENTQDRDNYGDNASPENNEIKGAGIKESMYLRQISKSPI